jgi:hypothetical protein
MNGTLSRFDRRRYRHPGGTRTCADRVDVKGALANELRSATGSWPRCEAQSVEI